MDDKRTILIVDDNPTNLVLASAVLRGSGYDVVCADGGPEMDARLQSVSPALILMDIQLPGEDGVAITRRLKADPATAHIPIIVLTAHAMQADEAAAKAAGCDGFITKPFSPQLLADSVAAVLPKGG